MAVIRGIGQTVGEAVVKPVANELGQMAGEAASGLLGKQAKTSRNQANINSQEQALKKHQEEIRKRNIIHFLNQYSKQEQALKQQRIIEEQKRQSKEKEEQEKKMKVKQFEITKKQKQESMAVRLGKMKLERKGGVGG